MKNKKCNSNNKKLKKRYWGVYLVLFLLINCLLGALLGTLFIKASVYKAGEENYHVKNVTSINVGSIRKEQKLQVMNISDTVYITEDTDDTATAWLKVSGTAEYTIDLDMGEFIVDEKRNYVLIRIPEPEFSESSLSIDKVEKLLLKSNKPITQGSVEEGVSLAKKQSEKAYANLADDIKSNELYLKAAKASGKKIIMSLVKSFNADNKNLKVEVNYY